MMARTFSPIIKGATALVLASGLAGCMDTLEASSGRNALVSAPGVPVALVSVDGLPQPVGARFQSALDAEAKRRQITLVQGSEAPRYKLKGYLSAYEVEGGTALAWVWDMYDTSDEKRARRVDGAQVVKKSSAEPWSSIDDAALQSAAASSMNEVASYLANPQALPVRPAAAQQVAAVSVPSLAAAAPVEAHPPRASNRPQPDPLPSVSAFAATFDLPGPGGRPNALGFKTP